MEYQKCIQCGSDLNRPIHRYRPSKFCNWTCKTNYHISNKNPLDKFNVTHLYRDQKLTITEINKLTGFSKIFIYDRLKYTGLLKGDKEAEEISGKTYGKPEVIKLYNHTDADKIKMSEIAKERFSDSAKRVRKNNKGYLYYCSGPLEGKLLHVIVAEEKIGRTLLKTETVHHIDEIKTNNHPNNIKVLSISEHSRLHMIKRIGSGEKPHLHFKKKLVLNIENGIYYETSSEAAIAANMPVKKFRNYCTGYYKNKTPYRYV